MKLFRTKFDKQRNYQTDSFKEKQAVVFTALNKNEYEWFMTVHTRMLFIVMCIVLSQLQETNLSSTWQFLIVTHIYVKSEPSKNNVLTSILVY